MSWAHGKLNHRGQAFNSLSIFDKNYQKNLHSGSKSPIFNSKIYKRLGNGMIFDQSGSTIPLIYFPKRPLRATPGPKQPTDHRQRPQAQTIHHIPLDLALRRVFVAKKICKVPKFVTTRIHLWVKFLIFRKWSQSLRSLRNKGQKTYYIYTRQK